MISVLIFEILLLHYFRLLGEMLTCTEVHSFVTKQEEIDEDDEKLLEAFLSKDPRPQRTLADLIVDKIKENDAQVSSGILSFSEFFYNALI